MINNGIISFGNNNNNTINNDNLDYTLLLEEINKLKAKSQEDLNNLLIACNSKNTFKIIEELKKLKKGTIELIKHLGLKILESLIEKYI